MDTDHRNSNTVLNQKGSELMNMYAYAADPCFEKLLSDNRERYIQQSINTRYGQVAQLPRRDRDESGDCREHVNAEMCVWFSDLED